MKAGFCDASFWNIWSVKSPIMNILFKIDNGKDIKYSRNITSGYVFMKSPLSIMDSEAYQNISDLRSFTCCIYKDIRETEFS